MSWKYIQQTYETPRLVLHAVSPVFQDEDLPLRRPILQSWRLYHGPIYIKEQ